VGTIYSLHKRNPILTNIGIA